MASQLQNAGYEVELASVKGGSAPVDPTSLMIYEDKEDESTLFYHNAAIKDQIAHTTDVHSARITPSTYRMVFIAGGHGPMIDLAGDQGLGKQLTDYSRAGGFIGAVCHGIAGLLNVTDKTGAPIVRGREVTCFTNAEEEQAGMTQAVPFLLEDKIKLLGAKFTCAGNMSQHVCVAQDVRLVTGQVSTVDYEHRVPQSCVSQTKHEAQIQLRLPASHHSFDGRRTPTAPAPVPRPW